MSDNPCQTQYDEGYQDGYDAGKAELEAEVERLREAINTHNDEKADQCLTNIKSGHCKPYTARGRRCPDCPLDGLIEALKESGDE